MKKERFLIVPNGLRSGKVEQSYDKAQMQQKRKKKERKPSMSLRTSFGLSLRNLISKKGRTMLASFAGSIGITYVLIAFVAVSLIVSSIMIGVITLISVQERTKEIGAARKDPVVALRSV